MGRRSTERLPRLMPLRGVRVLRLSILFSRGGSPATRRHDPEPAAPRCGLVAPAAAGAGGGGGPPIASGSTGGEAAGGRREVGARPPQGCASSAVAAACPARAHGPEASSAQRSSPVSVAAANPSGPESTRHLFGRLGIRSVGMKNENNCSTMILRTSKRPAIRPNSSGFSASISP